ncbi:MAG: GNAT family N-acetyltransferase [Methylovulum sp.]|nr:MAG: GNAT family N-acetyltransferase [Methylovulum sp.]
MSRDGIDIRPLRAEDFDAAYALWCAMDAVVLRTDDNPGMFGKFLERNPGCCCAAWHGGLLAGAVMAGHDGRRGYLYHLAVAPEYRRQGVGRALVEQALAALHEQGISKCHVFVKHNSRTAASFWSKLGWELREDIQVNSLSMR